MNQLSSSFIHNNDAGLKAIILRVCLCHLHVAGLAQNNGTGRITVLVIIVDEVGFLGKRVEVVLLARFQEDTALGDGGFLADKVPHIIKGDGHALAVHRLDLHRVRRCSRLHGLILLPRLGDKRTALRGGYGSSGTIATGS